MGSVGYYFRAALAAVAERHGMVVGQIIQAPINALVRYHQLWRRKLLRPAFPLWWWQIEKFREFAPLIHRICNNSKSSNPMNTLNTYNFAGKRAVMRVDFNVPLDKDLHITDDTRIRMATPSVMKILNDGGSVVLLSHLGRPKGGFEQKFSL